MSVTIKWLNSPRWKYGIPRAAGTIGVYPSKFLADIDPSYYEVIEKERPAFVHDSMVKKTRTRPVEKKS